MTDIMEQVSKLHPFLAALAASIGSLYVVRYVQNISSVEVYLIVFMSIMFYAMMREDNE